MRFLTPLALACLAGCATATPPDEPVVDPFPAAERFVWSDYLHEERPPPRIIYFSQPLTTEDRPGMTDIYDFVVFVRRLPTTTPAESYLCRGLMLEHLVGTLHDDAFREVIDGLDLEDPFRWGPAVDLCRYEIEHAAR